jgi:hypothetical protein
VRPSKPAANKINMNMNMLNMNMNMMNINNNNNNNNKLTAELRKSKEAENFIATET